MRKYNLIIFIILLFSFSIDHAFCEEVNIKTYDASSENNLSFWESKIKNANSISMVKSIADKNNEINHLYMVTKYYSAHPNDDITLLCISGFCDNTQIDEDKKLSINLDLDSSLNYDDVRIKINYLSVNREAQIEINVLDFDSLSFYVYDDNNDYGSFKIDDARYLGVFTRNVLISQNPDKYNLIYEDNYEIVSENLMLNNDLKNNCHDGCDLKIKIIPFDKYHASSSHFAIREIKIDGYRNGEVYQKEVIRKINNQQVINDIRTRIAYRMFYSASVKYTPNNSFTLAASDNLNNVNATYNNGIYYYGLPYGGEKISSVEEFKTRIDNLTYDEANSINGFSCSTSAMDAVTKNTNIYTSLDWSGKVFYSPDTKLVDCPSSINGYISSASSTIATITTECNNIDKTALTGYTAPVIRERISEQQMFYRYANINIGDLIVHKESCVDSNGNVISNCAASGHTRLVTEKPIIVFKQDQNGNYIIDGENSYIYVTEITKKDVSETLSEWDDWSNINWKQENITNFRTMERKIYGSGDCNINIQTSSPTKLDCELANSPTEWNISYKLSFKRLYGETNWNHIYFPFTFNTYNDIITNGFEVPYAKLIYNNHEAIYYDDRLYSDNNIVTKELASAIKTNKQLLGTIKTNYKLTKIKYEITLKDNNILQFLEYPVYATNNIQNRYSMAYENNLSQVLDNFDNISRIKITVLSVGPKLENINNNVVNDNELYDEINASNSIVVFDYDYDSLPEYKVIDEKNVVRTKTSLLNNLTVNSIKGANVTINSSNSELATGDEINITFNNTNDIVSYYLAFPGDVNDNSIIDLDDAKIIARHIVDKNVIINDANLIAADYNDDNQIKMNDVVKLLKNIN